MRCAGLRRPTRASTAMRCSFARVTHPARHPRGARCDGGRLALCCASPFWPGSPPCGSIRRGICPSLAATAWSSSSSRKACQIGRRTCQSLRRIWNSAPPCWSAASMLCQRRADLRRVRARRPYVRGALPEVSSHTKCRSEFRVYAVCFEEEAMKSLLLVMLMTLIACAAPIVAIPTQRAPTPPATQRVVRMKLLPATQPRPALRYQLIPPAAERVAGNAATLFLMAAGNDMPEAVSDQVSDLLDSTHAERQAARGRPRCPEQERHAPLAGVGCRPPRAL